MTIRALLRIGVRSISLLGHLLTNTGKTHTRMEQLRAKQINIALLGLAFLLVFTGFNTMAGIQALIFKSATTPDSGGYVDGFHGDGFISSAVIYAVFSFASWLAPSIVTWLGPKLSMFFAGILYAQYIAQLLYPNTYLLYTSAVIIGIGAPIIWTAQGTFLSINSDDETISRNSGIVWAMLQMSGFVGNIFAYFMFNGEEFISSSTRTMVGIVLLSVTVAGVVLMLFLQPTPWNNENRNDTNSNSSPDQALRSSFSLFLTKDMLLLSVTFFYTGLQLNIWQGVFATSIGFSKSYGENRKALATICMIFVAAGEVLGGSVFGFLGHLTTRRGRDPIIILGFVLSMITYFLMFLEIPFSAPLGETTELAFISSNMYLVIFTAFILGFSDACFNTQITSILGGAFKDQSSSAFAIFKFVQSMSAAIAFFYSPFLSLQWQLLVVVLFDILGSVAFCKVEWAAQRRERLPPTSDNSCRLEEEGLSKDESE